MNNPWTKKDLLSLYDLSAEEITFILDTAEEFKKVSQRKIKKVPALRGKTVVNLFIEPSTRTRISFELAEQRLSADIININAEASSLRKGETLLDTVKNIEALPGGSGCPAPLCGGRTELSRPACPLRHRQRR